MTTHLNVHAQLNFGRLFNRTLKQTKQILKQTEKFWCKRNKAPAVLDNVAARKYFFLAIMQSRTFQYCITFHAVMHTVLYMWAELGRQQIKKKI